MEEREFRISKLLKEVPAARIPIVYRPEYNIGFCGLEKLHPFDSRKWGNVFKYLKQHASGFSEETIVSPDEAKEEDLLVVHTKEYLTSLKWSANVARITEVCFVACFPNFLVQNKVLKPFRYQVGGTVIAGKLSVERGWAINIGGGFHHCSGTRGGGFCAYADITLCIKMVRQNFPDRIRNVMIIDLDAHQGNGHARDFAKDSSVYIFDAFNIYIYPGDHSARSRINKLAELSIGVSDDEYVGIVRRKLDESFAEFDPDLVLYNAGTDILIGDPLGRMNVTRSGIIMRDELVFQKARGREKKVPVIMVTSGGYLRETAEIIAESILNLRRRGLIAWPG